MGQPLLDQEFSVLRKNHRPESQKSIRSEVIKNQFLEELRKSSYCVVNLDDIDQQELYTIMNETECVSFDKLNGNPIRLNIVVGDYVPNSIVILPLKYQQQNVGIAVLLARNAFSNAFDTIETNNFIKQATPFLYNSSLIRRLEVLAAVDELTGVLNRRFGMQRLQEEFSRAHRYATSLSVCMLDMDKFKKTNDTYGHQAGDEVLRRLAEQLREGLRASDPGKNYQELFATIANHTNIYFAISHCIW